MLERPKYPQQIFRPIYGPTYHLTELAEPKKTNLLCTYKHFADYFDARRLKSMELKMKNLHYAPLPTVLKTYAMDKDFRKCHKSLAKKNRQIAKKKLTKLQEQYLRVTLENIFEFKKPYLLCPKRWPLNPSPHSKQIISGEQFARLRAILLRKMENIAKCGIQNKLLVELCDKLAVWICHYVSFSGYVIPVDEIKSQSQSDSVDKLSVPSSQMFAIDHYVSYSSYENILKQGGNVTKILSNADAPESIASVDEPMYSEQLHAEPAAIEALEQLKAASAEARESLKEADNDAPKPETLTDQPIEEELNAEETG